MANDMHPTPVLLVAYLKMTPSVTISQAQANQLNTPKVPKAAVTFTMVYPEKMQAITIALQQRNLRESQFSNLKVEDWQEQVCSSCHRDISCTISNSW